jgi:hypothetical protein
MTEQQWLTSTNFKSLTDYVVRDKVVSPRKQRLFAVACCRLVEHLLKHEESQKALEAVERFAEGLVKIGTLHRHCRESARLYEVERKAGNLAAAYAALGVHVASLGERYMAAAHQVTQALAIQAGHAEGTSPFQVAKRESLDAMIVLLRDIVGNPFQVLPAHNAAWLEANGGLAGRLANSIYDERKFGELPILADALEDAGCTEAALLEHLRGPGPHDRGCWALDVILGKG